MHLSMVASVRNMVQVFLNWENITKEANNMFLLLKDCLDFSLE